MTRDGLTTEEPLFNAEEGRSTTLLSSSDFVKGQALHALELREQSLKQFEADLRKRTARKLSRSATLRARGSQSRGRV